MADVEIRIKTAVDEARKQLDAIEKDLGDMGKAGKKAGQGFSDLEKTVRGTRTTIGGLSDDIHVFGRNIGSVTDGLHAMGISFPSTPMEAFGKGVQKAIAFVQYAAVDTLEYANSVSELTVAIGATPQEASKLIQVADDMGIGFETITRALEAGIRRGLNPTIDGIGKLSDQYLKLQPGVARTKFLLDNFGRSGADLARVMELGSEKIAEMGDEIEGTARLMDQEALDAAENYRMAIDELGDAFEDVKIGLGRGVIPALADFIKLAASPDADRAANFINEIFKGTFLESGRSKERRLAEAYGDVIEQIRAQRYATEELAKADNSAQIAAQQYAEAMRASGREGGILGGEMYNAAAASYAFKEATDRTNAALREEEQAAAEAATNIGKLIDQTNRDVGSAIADMIENMEWLMAGGGQIEAQFATIMEGIKSGKITPEEGKRLLEGVFLAATELQLELDQIDANAAATNIESTLNVKLTDAKSIVDQIMAPGQQVVLDVIVKYTEQGKPNFVVIPTGSSPGSGGGGGGGKGTKPKTIRTPDKGAPGGQFGLHMVVPPGYPNDSFYVRASSGEQVDIDRPGRGGAGGVMIGEINIFPPDGVDAQTVAGLVIREIEQRARARRQAGIGYAGQ